MLKNLIEQELKKYSQRELARRIGVSLGTIQNAIYGDIEFRIPTMVKFSSYFKKEISDVFPVAPNISRSKQDYDDIYMMKELIRMKNDIIDLGKEIGEIKSHLIAAGRTGDIKELMLIDGGKK